MFDGPILYAEVDVQIGSKFYGVVHQVPHDEQRHGQNEGEQPYQQEDQGGSEQLQTLFRWIHYHLQQKKVLVHFLVIVFQIMGPVNGNGNGGANFNPFSIQHRLKLSRCSNPFPRMEQ